MNTLPSLTRKQREIIDLLYSYRFLNRKQIQAFLKHKDYKTINLWLRDLLDKQYVERIYSTDFAERTKPAIYYLSLNGIRHLKSFEFYPVDELNKRYRETSRSQTYIDRCQLIADCVIALEQARKVGSLPESWYFYETEADYMRESYYHFLSESELIHPHLCFSKEIYEGGGDTYSDNNYLLEIFDPTLPRYRVKKRLANYVEYLDEESEEWKEGADADKLPIVMLVCPRTTDLIYAKRRMRGLLAELWEYEDEERPRIWFTTINKLKESSVTAEEIWEEA
jgi:hypothetical protein